MPRPPREDVAGRLHHIWARGSRQELIFRDPFDRLTYLVLLRDAVERWSLRCLSYCLMGNHVHLVIELREPTMAAAMHEFHGAYATRFNRRHGLKGHLFESRYKSKPVRTDAQFWQLSKYVALNPVEAGLCERPEEWRWSSYGGVVRGDAPAFVDVGRLLELFSGAGGDPMARYVAFVGQRPVG